MIASLVLKRAQCRRTYQTPCSGNSPSLTIPCSKVSGSRSCPASALVLDHIYEKSWKPLNLVRDQASRECATK